MAISPIEFDYISRLVRAKSGIVLDPGKEYLVETRMYGLLRERDIGSIGELIGRLMAGGNEALQQRVVEVMTTNETSFFRDQYPFDALRTSVMPALLAARAATRSLSIWCGASSAGQEPYTIAITLLESMPRIAEWNVTFLATDLSSEMIARSKAGRYNALEIGRGLPAALAAKYFDKTGAEYQAKPLLRNMIQFREMNLTQPWPLTGPIDIILLRNVLIYFDTETKKDILGKARRLLRPDGYLFLGSAETPLCLDDGYERLPVERSGCYRLKQAVSKAA